MDLKIENAVQLASYYGESLFGLSRAIHQLNEKWWTDIHTGEPIRRNVGELLMLAVSELAEALEGDRKNLMDNHLPTRKMLEVELADCIIRCLDIGCGLGLDVPGALIEKIAYNARREDHKPEARLSPNGKAY